MSLCTDKNLKDLKKAYKKRRIFKIELSEDTFTLICEILNSFHQMFKNENDMSGDS